MLNNIFSYRNGNNGLLYTLHPVTKFLFSFSAAAASGLSNNLTGFWASLCTVLVYNKAAGGVMKDIFSSLKPFRFLLLFTFIIQLFVSASGGLMFPVVSNAVQAVVITGRMAFIILFSSFFIRITPVTDIVRLFYHLFMPLKVFGIKPSEPALAMMIALRFIPLLFTEGEKIIDSRKLKNAAHMEENSKNIINSMKSSISLIIPLFARAFYYASQISVTLQYRRHDREFFKLESFKIRDAVSWICFPTVSALIILAGRYDFILW